MVEQKLKELLATKCCITLNSDDPSCAPRPEICLSVLDCGDHGGGGSSPAGPIFDASLITRQGVLLLYFTIRPPGGHFFSQVPQADMLHMHMHLFISSFLGLRPGAAWTRMLEFSLKASFGVKMGCEPIKARGILFFNVGKTNHSYELSCYITWQRPSLTYSDGRNIATRDLHHEITRWHQPYVVQTF